MSRRMRWVISGLLLAGAALIAGVSLSDVSLTRAAYSRLTYYIMWVAVGAWVAAIAQRAQTPPSSLTRRTDLTGLVVCGLLTGAIFLSVPSEFRILSDETNVVAVSRSMLYEHRAENVTEGQWYYGNFWPLDRELDRRPALVPFLAHLVHLALGYRPANAFVVNGLALWLLLALIYRFVQRHLGRLWACSAVLLVVAQPIVSLRATSGGIEMVNTLLLALSLRCLAAFLEQPSAATFRVLWCTLVLVMYARHESALVFPITLIGLGLCRAIRREWLAASIIYPLTAWLILPRLWQHVAVWLAMPGRPSWELGNVLDHLPVLVTSLLDVRFQFPYAAIVNLLGGFAVVRWLWRWSRGASTVVPPTPAGRCLLGVVAANALIVGLVGLTIDYGVAADHPTAARYFLPLVVGGSVAATFLVHRLVRRAIQHAVIGLVMALGLFALYHPIAMERRVTNQVILTRSYAAILEFLARQPDRHLLLIAARPGQYTVHHYGAISFRRANDPAFAERLGREFQRRLFPTILVIQEIEYASQQPTASTQLTEEFQLEPVFELQNTDRLFIRISRVVNPR